MANGEWLRPDAARLLDGEGLRILGSSGSTWSTAQRRAAQGWADAAAVPGNIYALADRQPGSFEATVAVEPRRSGEQAGLYAYAGDASWVKLVVEGAGDGDGVFLVFAEQRDGEPFLRGKLRLPQFDGSVALRLVAQPASGTALAFWRIGAGDWAAVTRGVGWLEPSELEPGQERGRLPPGDPRGEMVVAECALPDGWRAVLMTEQWPSSEGGGLAEVAFSAMASVPQPQPEPEPEPVATRGQRSFSHWLPAVCAAPVDDRMSSDEDETSSDDESLGNDVLALGHARRSSLEFPCWCVSGGDVGLRACYKKARRTQMLDYTDITTGGLRLASSHNIDESEPELEMASIPRPMPRPVEAQQECLETPRDVLEAQAADAALCIPERLQHSCRYYQATDLHVTCQHPLTLARDPFSFDSTVTDVKDALDNSLLGVRQEWDYDMTYQINWLCDGCGVEARLHLVYCCRPCSFCLCVPCALKAEPSPRAVGPLVKWMDLFGLPGSLRGLPEEQLLDRTAATKQ